MDQIIIIAYKLKIFLKFEMRCYVVQEFGLRKIQIIVFTILSSKTSRSHGDYSLDCTVNRPLCTKGFLGSAHNHKQEEPGNGFQNIVSKGQSLIVKIQELNSIISFYFQF